MTQHNQTAYIIYKTTSLIISGFDVFFQIVHSCISRLSWETLDLASFIGTNGFQTSSLSDVPIIQLYSSDSANIQSRFHVSVAAAAVMLIGQANNAEHWDASHHLCS